MKYLTTTFGVKVAFLFEKHSKTYNQYVDASITEEKGAIAQKLLQRELLCWSAGRSGV